MWGMFMGKKRKSSKCGRMKFELRVDVASTARRYFEIGLAFTLKNVCWRRRRLHVRVFTWSPMHRCTQSVSLTHTSHEQYQLGTCYFSRLRCVCFPFLLSFSCRFFLILLLSLRTNNSTLLHIVVVAVVVDVRVQGCASFDCKSHIHICFRHRFTYFTLSVICCAGQISNAVINMPVDRSIKPTQSRPKSKRVPIFVIRRTQCSHLWLQLTVAQNRHWST